jgi:hypothetical protein
MVCIVAAIYLNTDLIESFMFSYFNKDARTVDHVTGHLLCV